MICANTECGKSVNACYSVNVVIKRAHAKGVTNSIPVNICFECYEKLDSRTKKWNPYDENVLDMKTLLVVPKRFARKESKCLQD